MSPSMIPTLAEVGVFDWLDRLWLRAPAATLPAQETDDMFMWLWWFCLVWFVGLMGLMFFFVVKYRRRKGKIAERSASHNTWLEIGWTIVPTLFLVYIFFRGFTGYMDKVVPPGNAIELRLTGYKWSWKLAYPNGVEVQAGTLGAMIGAEPVPVYYLPAETPVKLRMNSIDVMHAFWVPDFRVKADLIPNRYTFMTFTPKGPGDGARSHASSQDSASTTSAFFPGLEGVPYTEHWVFCAEYCGTGHSEMAALIRVVPREAYDTWLREMVRRMAPSDPVDLGRLVWRNNCASCHSVDGGANTGPTWQNMFGYPVEFTDGTSYTAEQMSDTVFFANYIRESTRVPARKIVKGYGNNMNAFSEATLSDARLDAVIQFMMSREVSDRGFERQPAGEEGAADGTTPEDPASPDPASPDPASPQPAPPTPPAPTPPAAGAAPKG